MTDDERAEMLWLFAIALVGFCLFLRSFGVFAP